jgi:hypothetical protein
MRAIRATSGGVAVVDGRGHRGSALGGHRARAGYLLERCQSARFALGLKEAQLRTALYWGHHGGRRETDIAAEVLRRLPGLPDVLVSYRFELGDAARAFTIAADCSAGAVKAIVDVSTG